MRGFYMCYPLKTFGRGLMRDEPIIPLQLIRSMNIGIEFKKHGMNYTFLSSGPMPNRPHKNSLAVLNHKILEANSQVQNVKLGGHQTSLSINRLWHELCDMLRRLVGTTTPGHHDCSIQE
ncbi:uncharacterized protein TNCV_3103071 [Trichonephila clavipes]|nr:uncharacterized protein TNCV_3103071 [Trichonephila clavipes]